MQVVCEYTTYRTNLAVLQLVNRRFYLKFVSAVLHPICIFTRTGIKIKKDSAFIEVFSQSQFQWQPIFVKQQGEDMHQRMEFFESKDQSFSTRSKIVQINPNSIYVIGGV